MCWPVCSRILLQASNTLALPLKSFFKAGNLAYALKITFPDFSSTHTENSKKNQWGKSCIKQLMIAQTVTAVPKSMCCSLQKNMAIYTVWWPGANTDQNNVFIFTSSSCLSNVRWLPLMDFSTLTLVDVMKECTEVDIVSFLCFPVALTVFFGFCQMVALSVMISLLSSMQNFCTTQCKRVALGFTSCVKYLSHRLCL